MPKSVCVVLAGVIVFCLSNLSLLSEEPPVIKSISVRYVGSKLIAEQKVLSTISTKPGDRLSVYGLDDDLKKLHANGDIRNARFLSNKVSGGIDLIVVVECSALYGGVTFEGNRVFPDRKLEKTIDLPLNRTIQESAIHKAQQEIRAMYQKRGYSDTLVECHVGQPDSKGYAKLRFVIEERATGLLRNVKFEGNYAFNATRLKEVMGQKERGVQNVIGSRGRTDAESVAADVKALQNFYRENGYFDAKVLGVAKVPVDNRFDDLVFKIREGKVYTISSIKVNGVEAFSADSDLAPHFKTKAGQAFSANSLDTDMKMILEHYRSKGYVNATVTPKIVEPGR